MSGKSIIVAIDGPVASGKGTLSRKLAEHFGFRHLDTGALYRAAALNLRRAGGDADNLAAAVAAARAVGQIDLADPALRDEETGLLASKIAPLPEVRKTLLEYQREFAARPPGGAVGAILEGRDITTVVCPDAEVKIFVTAAAEVRAKRRYDELIGRGVAADYETVLADLKKRDAQDSERTEAPLKIAADAHLLDTSILDIDTAFGKAVEIIRKSLGDRG